MVVKASLKAPVRSIIKTLDCDKRKSVVAKKQKKTTVT